MLTTSGIGYDRAGPRTATPVVLLHAGIADRRMWDDVWRALTTEHDVVRLDLRGFGESSTPPLGPSGALDPLADVRATLQELEIARCHLVGTSYGAGVAAELAVAHPDLVKSLVLCAPGGALIAELTPQLTTFVQAEREALARGDLDAAVTANLETWVAPGQRERVAPMQRRAFELSADWDVDEVELDPPVLERLAEIRVPTLILVGGDDLDAVQVAATALATGVPGAVRVDWPGVRHLPSMERPEDFLALLAGHLAPPDHFTDAAGYDEEVAAVPEAALDLLAALAAGGRALELAVGTGRVAIPLAARGVDVAGIELSPAMSARLRSKTDAVSVSVGDMTGVRVEGGFALVYLVFNTIMNLTSQDAQVACFANAAAHLRPGGHFLVEVGVPALQRLPPGERYTVFERTDDGLGVDEYDVVHQRQWSHHYRFAGDRVQRSSPPFRYVWPAELDLMARLAGMRLADRWADWDRSPFTALSRSHVSVYRLPGPAG